MKKVFLAFLLLWLGGALASQKILIDGYYAEEGTNIETDSSIFISNLHAGGFVVDINNEKLTKERLEGYDVLILQNPSKVLEKEEQDAILDFVKKGGGLIVSGMWTKGSLGWVASSRESFNELVSNFGMVFEANAVDDVTNKAGCHCTPIIHTIKPHKTTEGIEDMVFLTLC